VNLGAFGNTLQAEASWVDVTWKDQVTTVAANGCSLGGNGEPPLGGSLLAILGAVYIAKRRSRRQPVRHRRRIRWVIFRALVLASLLGAPAHASPCGSVAARLPTPAAIRVIRTGWLTISPVVSPVWPSPSSP
jgi:hypothetical protein